MNADQITGERVHILLRRRGIQQQELADILGLTQTSASRKILGKRSWTLDELLATARFLGVPVTELLPEDDYAPIPVGRGRSGDIARPKGLEPPTFWFGASHWTPEDETAFRAFADDLRLNLAKAARRVSR